MKIAVPDMISNSYFPAEAAVELGFFRDEGLDVTLEMIFPVDKAYMALRDGAVDFVGGSAHSALAAFPQWGGVKLICAQAQGMYWFLVMHQDFAARRGDVGVVKGRSIGAAPWVEMGLRRLLIAAGIDLKRDDVKIAPVPGAVGAGVNFGLTAAKALEERKIDGFWANGMGAEVAVRRGVGTVVLDVRRGDGPKGCFDYTMASIATTQRLIDKSPEVAAAAVRAIVKTQHALKKDVTRAAEVGRTLFPPAEAELIVELIRRDLPYYDAVDFGKFRGRHEPVRPRRRNTQRECALRKSRGDAVPLSLERLISASSPSALKLPENLVIVLAERGRRRVDARAAMREREGRERHAEAALDARAASVAVNDAAGRKLRIGERFAHGAHARGRHVARLQELLPFVGGAREHDLARAPRSRARDRARARRWSS